MYFFVITTASVDRVMDCSDDSLYTKFKGQNPYVIRASSISNALWILNRNKFDSNYNWKLSCDSKGLTASPDCEVPLMFNDGFGIEHAGWYSAVMSVKDEYTRNRIQFLDESDSRIGFHREFLEVGGKEVLQCPASWVKYRDGLPPAPPLILTGKFRTFVIQPPVRTEPTDQ